MKKSILIILFCGLLLTSCGKSEESAVMIDQTQIDVTTVQSESPKITKTESAKTTTVPTVSVTESPNSTKIITSNQTTKKPVMTTEKSQNIDNQPNTQPQENDVNKAVQESQEYTSKPQTTTAKVTTTKPVTTTKTGTTTHAPVDNSIVDLNAVSDQMWGFLTLYPIDYEVLYETGEKLNHDGTEYGKAMAAYDHAVSLGGRNCIEYALNTYFLCKSLGVDCYIAMTTSGGWYNHVCTAVKVNGVWYIHDAQAEIPLSANYGLDKFIDVYEKEVSLSISNSAYRN